MTVHLWAPGFDPSAGGIEGYSHALARALSEIVGASNLTVLAKNESARQVASCLPESVSVCGFGDRPRLLRTALFALALVRRALTDRPDLIITTHLNFAPVAEWLHRYFKIPFWVSLHGVEAWDLLHPARRNALAHANLLLPVSRHTRDRVAHEQRLDLDRFAVLPDCVDESRFSSGPKPGYLLERYGLSAGQPVILTIGRLSAAEQYKGHDRVLRVLKAAAGKVKRRMGKGEREEKVERRKEKGEGDEERKAERLKTETLKCDKLKIDTSRSLRYLIVGDGDDRARLEQIAREEGVADVVTFAGRVPAEEIPDHYRLCDLFAMPSTGEGFGIVFLEALASGRPVLAGSTDASRDPLRDGELGVLVDPDDPEALRDAIVAVLGAAGQPEAWSLELGAGEEARREKAETLKTGTLKGAGGREEGEGRKEKGESQRAEKLPGIMFQPEALRAKVIEHFGYERFKENLAGLLERRSQSEDSKVE